MGLGLCGAALATGALSAGASEPADWTVQQKIPAALAYLDSVACPTTSVCMAVGGDPIGNGKVELSTDGGTSWQVQALPAGIGPLVGVTCVNASTCWAVGADPTDTSGVVVETSDGGATWTQQQVPAGTGPLQAVACTSTEVCWGAGGTPEFGAAVIVGTTDGGATWHAEAVPSEAGPLAAISCSGSSTCWAAGSDPNAVSGIVIATSDGGGSWVTQAIPSGSGPLSGIACQGAGTCVAVGTDATFTVAMAIGTSDGGAHWSAQPVPASAGPLHGVACASASSDCWAVGSDATQTMGAAIATTNAGSTWQAQTLPGTVGQLVDVSCPSSSACVAVGDGGTSAPQSAVRTAQARLAMGGRAQSLASPRLSANVAVPRISVGVGFTSFVAGAPIAVTTNNAGSNWSSQPVTSTSDGMWGLGPLSCLSTTTCWALATDATGTQVVLATKDGWSTWSSSALPANGGIYSGLTCPTATDCWAVGGSFETGPTPTMTPSVAATTDGGTTWHAQNLSGVGLLSDISCASMTSCEAVGFNFDLSSSSVEGVAFGTTDGGTTWTSQSLPSSVSQLSGISCATASLCIAVGQSLTGISGIVLDTTDGGATWASQTVPAGTEALTSVSCPTASDCWASGVSPSFTGVILATANGGGVWSSQTVPGGLLGPVTDISCPTSSSCEAIGSTLAPSSDLGEGVIIGTADGATWSTQTISENVSTLTSIDCSALFTCWADGNTSSQLALLETTTNGVPPTTTTSTTTTTIPGGGGSPYELYCPGTPIGNVVLNDVTTVGTLSPTSPATGDSVNLDGYQTEVIIPQNLVTAASAFGSTLDGSVSTAVDATGATPAKLSLPTMNFSVPIPEPPTALTLQLPSPAATIGPFTVTGTDVTLSVDSSMTLTLLVSGNPLTLTCHVYPNNSLPTGTTESAPSGNPILPVIASTTTGSTTPSTTTTSTTTASTTSTSSVPSSSATSTPGATTTTAPPTAAAGDGSTPSSASSLASTGPEAITILAGAIGLLFVLAGVLLLLLVDAPRRALLGLQKKEA